MNLNDECWPFQGFTNKKGHGIVNIGGTSTTAHKLVYEVLVGEVPEGLLLHHTCELKSCVNPGHLIPVTPAEHSLLHRSPICIKCGMNDWYGDGGVGRKCRNCKRIRNKRRTTKVG